MQDRLARAGFVICLTLFAMTVGVAHPLAADISGKSAASSGNSYEQAVHDAQKELAVYKSKENDSGRWNLPTFFSLVALVLAVGLTLWLARWTRRLPLFRAGEREMQLLDRMVIGKHTTLLLIRVRGRDFWLAGHSEGVTQLADWPMAEKIRSPLSSPTPEKHPAQSYSQTPDPEPAP